MDPNEDIQTSKTVDLDLFPAPVLQVRLPVMPFRPGNAWAQMQMKEREKQLQASTSSRNGNSCLQQTRHFNHPPPGNLMISTASEDIKGITSPKSTSPTSPTSSSTIIGLDLNEELAIPMPKLNLIRSSPLANADQRPGKVERSVTIPNFGSDVKATGKKSAEKKKKSKVATILKNKWSLIDIAKESKKNTKASTRQDTAAKPKELPAIPVSKESIPSFAEPKLYAPKPKDPGLYSSAPPSAILDRYHDSSSAPELPSARHTRSAPILSATLEAGESKNEYPKQTSVDDCIAPTKYSNAILASEKGEANDLSPSLKQNNESTLSIPNSLAAVTGRQVEDGRHSNPSVKTTEKGPGRGVRGDAAEKNFPKRRDSTASARQVACGPPVHGATGIGTWDQPPAVFRPEEDVGRQSFNNKRKNRHQMGVCGEGEPGPAVFRSQNPGLAPLAPAFRPNPPGGREGQYDLSMTQVDEGSFLGGTTRHGGYAPPPPHPSYQNTLTLEQQLASHTNSVHHHLNGVVDRVIKVFGDSHNWLTDQILRSIENLQDSARVISSRAVAQSEIADELRGLMSELRSDIAALKMDMRSMDRRYTHEYIALHKKLDAIKLVMAADEGIHGCVGECFAASKSEGYVEDKDLDGSGSKTTISPTENTDLDKATPKNLDTKKGRPNGGFTTPCDSLCTSAGHKKNEDEDGGVKSVNRGCQANIIRASHESMSSGENSVSLSVPLTPSTAPESFEQRKHKRGVFGFGRRRHGNSGKDKTPRSYDSGFGNNESPDHNSQPPSSPTEGFRSTSARMGFTSPGDSSETSIHTPVFKPQQRQQGGYQRHQSHTGSSPVSYHRQQQYRAGYGNGPFPQPGNSPPKMSVYPQPQNYLSRGHGPNPVLPGASATVRAPTAYGITTPQGSRNWYGEGYGEME
ncbi:hypothetical protein V8E54_014485 [Elaphomyces granulatus]